MGNGEMRLSFLADTKLPLLIVTLVVSLMVFSGVIGSVCADSYGPDLEDSINSGIFLTPGHIGEDYSFIGDYADGHIAITGPGEYYLYDNLTSLSSDYAIQILSPHVTLNGYGYTILGNGIRYSAGVHILPSGKNGIVTNISSLSGFYWGIASEGDNSCISDIFVHDNLYYGIHSWGNYSEISRNFAFNNRQLGIYSLGHHTTIHDNYASYSWEGILSQGNFANLSGNVANENSLYGIYAGGYYVGPEPGDEGYGYYPRIIDNIAILNVRGGIRCSFPHAVIQGNSVFQNMESGITFGGWSNNTTISDNYISDNPIGVVASDMAVNVSVTRNLIRSDGKSGIFVNSHTGTGSVAIYDNIFSSQEYVNGTGNIRAFSWTNPSGPTPGTNIMNGPNIAGNFWTNKERSGWSDKQPPQKSGYSPLSYEILAGSGVYDTAPLVRPGNEVTAFSDDWTIVYPGGMVTHKKYSDVMYITQGKPGAMLTNITVDGKSVKPDSHYDFYEIDEDHTIETEGSPVPGQIHVRFDITPKNGTYPLDVQFTDNSIGNPTSWFWQFGDGENSTEQNPDHSYYVPGTYTVSLRAMNNQSGGSSVCNGCVEVLTI